MLSINVNKLQGCHYYIQTCRNFIVSLQAFSKFLQQYTTRENDTAAVKMVEAVR